LVNGIFSWFIGTVAREKFGLEVILMDGVERRKILLKTTLMAPTSNVNDTKTEAETFRYRS
jgi:hypothetical protein